MEEAAIEEQLLLHCTHPGCPPTHPPAAIINCMGRGGCPLQLKTALTELVAAHCIDPTYLMQNTQCILHTVCSTVHRPHVICMCMCIVYCVFLCVCVCVLCNV